MEAVGLTVGVPGLAVMLWFITKDGLKIFADCRDLPAEHQHIVHLSDIDK